MPLRPGSFLDRLQNAGRLILGHEERSGQVPAPFLAAFGGLAGMPAPFKAYESLSYYGDNPWLYAAISLVSVEASRVKLRLYRKKKNGEDELIEDHQALSTLKMPMPIKGGRSILTQMQFKQLLFKYVLLNGEGFMLLDGRLPGKFGGGPSRLHPLMPAFVFEKLDENFEIESYIYRAAGSQMELDPLDVIHFKDPDPKNWYRGHSPVQSARYALDSHKEADVLNFNRFQNGAVPSGVLSSDQSIGQEERKRLRDAWMQNYGGSKNSGKIAVMPNGLKFDKTQESNADMQYAELKNLSKDEILANYRIPIEMLGHTESQTRANAEASNYVFQRFTVLPLVESFVDTLTNDYLPAFPKTDDLYFSFEEFVPQDLDDKRKTTQMLFGMGALRPDEGRAAFELEPLETDAANATYVPFNITPLETVYAPIDDDVEQDLEGDSTDETGRKAKKKRLKRADDQSDDLPDDVSEFFDKKKEAKKLSALSLFYLIEAFRRGNELANQGAATPVPYEDVFRANVKQAIEEKSLTMSAQATQTTEDQLRQVLSQAYEDGVGVRELARRINALYGESMGYRSLRIARTEMTGSINDGALRTYQAQGYEEKMWSTTMDGKERDSHGEADGQTVPIDEPFHLAGGDGMYPGDPSLPPEELVNCRCVLQPSGEIGDPEDRQHKRNEMFLRYHADVEAKFQTALVADFKRQRDSILHRLVPPNL
jgi:HK97 family phage portal protein